MAYRLLWLLLATQLLACLPARGSMPARTWRAGEDGECAPETFADASAWNEFERVALEAKLAEREAVVVSALGCRVEVLAACSAPVAYRMTETARVDRYQLPRPVAADELGGRCDRATHVVLSAHVGEGGAERVELVELSLAGFDVSGTWEGVMTQPNGPFERYDLLVDLEQRGSRVVGTSYLNTTGGEYWGVLRFEGTLVGNTLYFADDALLDDNLDPLLGWCMKGGYLLVDPKRGRLSGLWRAFACEPGAIDLERNEETAPRARHTSPSDSRG